MWRGERRIQLTELAVGEKVKVWGVLRGDAVVVAEEIAALTSGRQQGLDHVLRQGRLGRGQELPAQSHAEQASYPTLYVAGRKVKTDTGTQFKWSDGTALDASQIRAGDHAYVEGWSTSRLRAGDAGWSSTSASRPGPRRCDPVAAFACVVRGVRSTGPRWSFILPRISEPHTRWLACSRSSPGSWWRSAGAGALGAIALSRGEPVNGLFFVVAAGGTYLVAYRFYAAFIAARVLALDGTRATPAERLDDGRDFVPTNKWVVFGHHFAAIAGPGPLVGPTLAAQFGYLPGTLWIMVGAVLGGCVQDFVILFFSLRRDGRSLGQMARDEIGRRAGLLTMVSVLAIMIILLAVVALVVVNALKHSPWGAFTLAMTIPIALFMGVYMRYLRPGRVLEASAIGLALVLFAVVGRPVGGPVAELGARLHADRPGARARR